MKNINNNITIDGIDKEIIRSLMTNARTPILEIAKKIGVSGAAIHQRLRKLENSELIEGSKIIINPKVLGHKTMAFIGIYLEKAGDNASVVRELKKIPEGSKVQIFTDSKYVKSGITEWIHNWKKNGWKTANKQEVKNKDLWTELDIISNKFEISWNWVKAHSSDQLNNEVDAIARKAANQ